jgi:CspA family cold shock protein
MAIYGSPADVASNLVLFPKSNSALGVPALSYGRRARMMATGTVKSFNRSKHYGFIRMDSDGKEVFVHASAMRKAGLAGLRKGQKLSFEIFDNEGKAAAKNLQINGPMKDVPADKAIPIQNGVIQNVGTQLAPRRVAITRAALELALTEAVRKSSPECSSLVGVIVERVVPEFPGDANWAVKGIKYGKAERDRCRASVSKCVEEGQSEYEISD